MESHFQKWKADIRSKHHFVKHNKLNMDYVFRKDYILRRSRNYEISDEPCDYHLCSWKNLSGNNQEYDKRFVLNIMFCMNYNKNKNL